MASIDYAVDVACLYNNTINIPSLRICTERRRGERGPKPYTQHWIMLHTYIFGT
jgi:hypothetical protein